VVCGGRPPERSPVSFVDMNNVAGARGAVEHLIELGRRRIAHIAGPLDMPAGQDRLRGFRDAMAQASLSDQTVAYGDFGLESGQSAMKRLLGIEPAIDAVFVASDLMAAGALHALHEAARRVPEDVAIVGFDDSPIATSTEPRLSSVRQPIEEQGREMTRLLLRLIRQEEQLPRQVILGTELQPRESTLAKTV
jgi:DNA-binding LacI/PurR family transcriptional regulator